MKLIRPIHILLLVLSLTLAPGLTMLLAGAGGSIFAQGSQGGSKSMWSFLTEGNFEPIIEGSYGYGLFDQKLFVADLPKAGVLGLKLGYREVRPFKTWGMKLDERFLAGDYAKSTVPPGKANSGGMDGEWWRVSTGQRSGYGWALGNQSLIPFHQYAFGYTEATFTNTASLGPDDSARVARVMGAGRLSMSTEAGLTAELFSSLSASAGYEASIIYTRLVFPQWICSYLLLGSSVVIISDFAQDIVSSHPVLGPLLYFVLRNAVAYSFFYAFRGEMNWPFHSETPFMTHTFKIDVSLRF